MLGKTSILLVFLLCFIHYIICVFPIVYHQSNNDNMHMYWHSILIPPCDRNWNWNLELELKVWNWNWNCKLWDWNRNWNCNIWKCRNWNWNRNCKIGIDPSPGAYWFKHQFPCESYFCDYHGSSSVITMPILFPWVMIIAAKFVAKTPRHNSFWMLIFIIILFPRR